MKSSDGKSGSLEETAEAVKLLGISLRVKEDTLYLDSTTWW